MLECDNLHCHGESAMYDVRLGRQLSNLLLSAFGIVTTWLPTHGIIVAENSSSLSVRMIVPSDLLSFMLMGRYIPIDTVVMNPISSNLDHKRKSRAIVGT